MKQPKIQLIAIDLDGTLLDDHKEISSANMEALHAAHNAGMKIVICTGRPYLAMKHIMDEIGLISEDDYIIIFNGAQVRNAQTDEILIQFNLGLDDLKRWLPALEKLALPVNVVDNDWVYEPLTYPDDYPSFYASEITDAPSKIKDFDTFTTRDQLSKLVVTVDETHLATQLSKLPQTLVQQYSTSRSHPFQYEIMHPEANKGNAVTALADKLNIPIENVMVIGDQANDLAMFEIPTYKVAVGNAIPEIKEHADLIVATNNDSGVAEAIHSIL